MRGFMNHRHKAWDIRAPNKVITSLGDDYNVYVTSRGKHGR